MPRETLIQIACLYGSISAAAILIFLIRPRKSLAIGLVYSTAWVAALLPWLDFIAQASGLWSYAKTTYSLGRIPLALYLGWVVAWGVFAPLISHFFGKKPWLAVATIILLDLWLMPEMTPLLTLSQNWFIGEIAITLLLLVPSIYLAQWTESSTKLPIRCAMLAPAFGGIILGIPLLALSGSPETILEKWLSFSDATQIGYILSASILSLPGLTALRDLALSGKGTPVPLEPPQHLVDHGIYAYIRNPMQFSMTNLLILESHFLWSPWPLLIAIAGLVYSEGFARWSENQDMNARFGNSWAAYKATHRPWLPTFFPESASPSELWYDDSCTACHQTANWFANRSPIALKICKASEWPGDPLERITWHHPTSGRTEHGVTAVAMALQHLHLGWALVGWIIGLPGLSHVIQICLDASGAGKR